MERDSVHRLQGRNSEHLTLADLQLEQAVMAFVLLAMRRAFLIALEKSEGIYLFGRLGRLILDQNNL